ncbi:MAG: NAD(P)/FAD-dependent oxidoreductase [Mesorhizobium sp.]|uniref:FAD/NAD(P)-dependent oxidoreductase n=1 Tax=Mesorhizobium sp. TaxID=1871066 RepID=UPI001ACA6788|nr:FAD/NAD(P)-binding oxidoreductase [Mesorhizobium sp.]MBN9217298.1 NAD(P)/FAD-dependent oxidoreductase [Mesorhizobium sp.]
MAGSDRIVVVGTGPAGSRAAQTLYGAGCRNLTVISEAPASGGQIYRRQPVGFERPPSSLYGEDAPKAVRLHGMFDALAGKIDYRPNTLVWNIFDGAVHTHDGASTDRLEFDRLVLSTGAMDRVIPIPGWTLPGVFTLGGSQIALKNQACSIGRAVVFAGTGPLLYLVAYQYAKAGANVVAVLDSASYFDKVRGAAWMARSPKMLLRGLAYRRYLARKRVMLREGVRLRAVEGADNVEGIRFTTGGRDEFVQCDAVGLGFGLTPEMQLAEIAGCRTRFDADNRQWVIAHDGQGRAGNGIYVAGDGSAIGGADVAELAGERAALALLADIGLPASKTRLRQIERASGRLAGFRKGVETSFPFPAAWIDEAPDETILCRCENVSFGEVRAAIARFEPREVNRLKALARPGMGRCQGRVCGPVLAELLSAVTGRPLEQVGKLRGQGPVKPISYGSTCGQADPQVHAWMLAGEKSDADDQSL